METFRTGKKIKIWKKNVQTQVLVKQYMKFVFENPWPLKMKFHPVVNKF